MSRWRRVGGWWPAAALAAAVAGVFHEALFTSRVFFERDLSLVWYPRIASMVRSVGEGAWPLWDPYPQFGVSAIADPSYQICYPFTWLNLILSPALFLKLFVVGHCLWAGVGLMLLARRLGMARAGAVTAGAAWVAGGPLLSLVTQYHHLASASWMPWVVWAFLGVLDRATVRSSVLLAACGAAELLGGSADMCHLSAWLGLFCALASAGHWSGRPRRENLKALGLLAGSGALAFCLAAPQWLPTIVQMRSSTRSAYGPEVNMYWSLHPAALVDAWAPRLVAGAPLSAEWRGRIWEGREPLLTSIYLGAATLPLVFLGLVSARRRQSLALGIGLTFTLLAALGRYAFVYPLLLKLPVVALFRYPVKWMVAASFLWALLAGAGLAACLEEPDARRRRSVWLALALTGLSAALALWGAWRLPAAGQAIGLVLAADLGPAGRAAALTIAGWRLLRVGVVSILALGPLLALAVAPRRRRLWALAIACVALADLVVAGAAVNGVAPGLLLDHRPPVFARLDSARDGYRIFSVPFPDWSPAQLVARAPRGWTPAWAWALSQIDAVSPLSSGRWGLYGSFDDDATGLADENLPLVTGLLAEAPHGEQAERILQMWNVRYVIGLEQDRFALLDRVDQWQSVASVPLCLWRVPAALPRAFVASGARAARGLDALGVAIDPGFDPRREIILEDARDARAVRDGFQGSARAVSRRSDRVEIESIASGDGYVVLVDGYDPGWQAAVDDRPARVLRANLVCRAVAVPAGRHRVVFTYRPPSVAWGLGLGALGLVVVLASAWSGARSTRVSQRSALP